MTRSSRATALLAAAGVATLAACGGSTGREGLPISFADATSETGASAPVMDGALDPLDSTVADAGQPATGDTATNPTFDATVEYADAARLPDVGAPTEAATAMEAGGPPPVWTTWPACACEQVDLTKFNPQSTLVDSGAIVMDNAAACHTQIWTHSADCDNCLRNNGFADSTNVFGLGVELFPPCCDLARDGGLPSAGPAKGTGETQFQLCAELLECLLSLSSPVSTDAYCGAGVSSAACGSGMAQGPCKAQIEAAEETTAGQEILNDWAQSGTTQGKVGSEGQEAVVLYKSALQSCATECLPSSSSSSGDASPDGH
jgi:hypothetical protein